MTPKGYSATQIALHWAIALLVVLQFVLNEGISGAWEQVEEGAPVTAGPLVAQHIAGGVLILLLVVWRISLRVRRGAPPPPEDEHPLLQLAAKASHGILNLLLLALPITGGLAWFGGIEAMAEVHEAGKTVLMALVLLHVLAVLYHQFVLRTNIIDRMRRPAD